MAERRSWVDVKMELEEAANGNHGRNGWRRGMRSGVIGLAFVRRRRISAVQAMRWGRRRDIRIEQSVSI